MKKLAALGLPLILVGAIGLVGCGKGGGTTTAGGPGPLVTTIDMDAANFTQHAVQVKSGQPVSFDDTVSGGGTHILCIGTGNGGTNSCDASGDGPSELYGSGLTLQGGDKKDITFDKAGTYRIICTIHPGMYIEVTVQ